MAIATYPSAAESTMINVGRPIRAQHAHSIMDHVLSSGTQQVAVAWTAIQTSAAVRVTSEADAVQRHRQNWQRDTLQPIPMRKRKGEFSDWQLCHNQATTADEMQEVWRDRQLCIALDGLADTYLKARCGALRRWIWVCVEAYGTTPWRTHWPKCDELDQPIMLSFIMDASIRYKDRGSIAAARGHVEQFHLDLGITPPALPVIDHYIRKTQAILQDEHLEGRAMQGAWIPADFEAHCTTLRQQRDAAVATGDKNSAAQLMETLLALCAIYEVSGRVGNYCPGTAFKPGGRTWTKATLWWLIHPDDRMEGAKAIQLPQPQLKTARNHGRAANARPTQSRRMSAWQAEIGSKAHFGRRAHFSQKWSSTATKRVAHRHQTSRDPPVGQTSAACDA
eukprot:SAG31_NODE_5230_length_2660_cov_6.073799_3_plen_393_part_00